MDTMLWAALAYADLGYPVFPCAPGRKQPLTEHGFLDATTDVATIESWWTTHPSANIAVATAGLVVIDVDGPHNPWLSDQPDRAHELAQGVVALTPGGGRHYIFRQPDHKAYRCHTGQLAPHVDVRATGGYILLPPSVVEGKAYQYVAGLELDRPRDQLASPPSWLAEQLDALATGTPTSPNVATATTEANVIPHGQRNATLARLAGNMRRAGMSQVEILAALERVNADRCVPSLPPSEVALIAGSIARYAPDEITVALVEDHWQQMIRPEGVQFQAITSRELSQGNFQLNYLIDGMLVAGQPGVIAGPKKTLKTNIAIDLALSLSSQSSFLGKFPVSKAVRVGIMSGESGAATIQETARRIAVTKKQPLEAFDNVLWSFEVPQLGNALHTDALRKFIGQHTLDVLILDPTYLMMMGLDDQAGNLFVVGRFLKSLGDLATETGCTPILCHHLKKGIADPYEPAELENIAWAGFQEFVRQWILLNRRRRYDPEQGGHHELWMSVGGSAGHSGLWGVNIDEGTRQDQGGRRWDVEVIVAADAYEARDEEEEESLAERKERHNERRADRERNTILVAFTHFPEGETARRIREEAGVSSRRFNPILEQLIAEGLVEACEVAKANGQKYGGFRLTGTLGLTGTFSLSQ
jgi:replicative DNA helicase